MDKNKTVNVPIVKFNTMDSHVDIISPNAINLNNNDFFVKDDMLFKKVKVDSCEQFDEQLRQQNHSIAMKILDCEQSADGTFFFLVKKANLKSISLVMPEHLYINHPKELQRPPRYKIIQKCYNYLKRQFKYYKQ